jgi:hypothetical protein
MDARTIAGVVASGRIAAGAGLTLAPGLVTRTWIGDVAGTSGARVVSAGFGARDVAIGAGTARALVRGEPVRPWLLAGAFADAVDLVATFAGRRSLPPLGVVSACTLAATGVVAGLWAARELGVPNDAVPSGLLSAAPSGAS